MIETREGRGETKAALGGPWPGPSLHAIPQLPFNYTIKLSLSPNQKAISACYDTAVVQPEKG